ncbi:MAG: DUF4982 domain-containing protein [Pontiellaceae bacterium]|nr:DUF4982 domain-containing protein [Pontiellaceae bacterium]
MKYGIFLGMLGLVLPVSGQGFGRSKLVRDWQFHLGDDVDAASGELSSGAWQSVAVPHDWSVEQEASPDKASCTGYLPGGIGWYKTSLDIPAAQQGKRFYLYFEGVYNRSEVFVNGASVGRRPNGYVSFMYDVTEQLKPGEKNDVYVRVDHSLDADSRWYTGSGIYRPVHLIVAEPVHIGLWGVYWVADRNKDGTASVGVETTLENHQAADAEVVVSHRLLDADGATVAEGSKALEVAPHGDAAVQQEFQVTKPKLWSVESPYLYTLETTVTQNGKTIDRSSARVGIRSLTFDADKGFALNGMWMKVKGVCLHHDAGVLGAAVPKEVWRARLLQLKEIGCNAIRMSHNPQATALYDLCDELGFLVMDEAFDEWEYPKKKWIKGWNQGDPGFQGSADFFEEWAERDVAAMVKRDRTHPSIIMWSIGNEVDYPNDPYSHPILDDEGIGQQHQAGYQKDHPSAERLGDIAKKLAAVVRGLDRSRPVTAALAGAVMSNETEYPGALDIVGYNYTENRYQMDHEKYPERVLFGSETRHDLAAWKSVADNDFIFGQFIWTGFDYLGEAGAWPSRGFTTGMVDLANTIKPRGYFRRALWSTKPVAYVGTSVSRGRNSTRVSMDSEKLWNYREGQNIRVVCYTNGDEAELFLNGERVGERKPYDADTAIIYWDIPYTPGELKVVAYKDGKKVAEDSVKTAGEPKALRAEAAEKTLRGRDGVAVIEVSIVDAEGVLARQARNEIVCNVSGAGKLLGLENASNNVAENFRDNRAAALRGRLLAYVQTTADAGEVTVSFSAEGLEPTTLKLGIVSP